MFTRPLRWELLAWFRSGCLALSVVLCAVVACCYALRPDAVAALTLLPPWLWLGPGLLLAAIGWSRADLRWAASTLVIWIIFLIVFAEEPTSLIRALRSTDPGWDAARERGEALRVVSLNCNGGNTNAALEVVALQPDIVLLQESPRDEFTAGLAAQISKQHHYIQGNGDSSILARGEHVIWLHPSAYQGQHFAHASVRLANGREIEVFNVRLSPYPVRVDLWSLECWKEQAAARRGHRRQIEPLLRQLASIPRGTPVLVGGDFNEPGRDAVPCLLQPRLHDTFREAGRGWGNTILNDFPVLRIDQVWGSGHFRAESVRAVRTIHSDHRMVICDLWLPR
jgi:endonuclease/exonuclease/phosphatase (EEP) superfamily protein YafD